MIDLFLLFFEGLHKEEHIKDGNKQILSMQI
jgi:hypothetical protein